MRLIAWAWVVLVLAGYLAQFRGILSAVTGGWLG